MSSRQKEYEAYLKSPTWKALRQRAIDITPYCVLCSSSKNLQVHHRKYPKILGEELVIWLTVLCKTCHSRHHGNQTETKKSKKKKKRIGHSDKDKTNGRRGRCPKCLAKMQTVRKRPEERKFKPEQKFYFSEWDVCSVCRYIQHYEKFKVMI